MNFITRPLEKWPRPETRPRRNSPYAVGYARSTEDLERELRHLGVRGDVVIQMDVQEHEITLDGRPRSSARPRTPRVAIAFTSARHGPLIYYCDKFLDWQDNVRAIALGMQRLRLVEETGIISRGEQYTGFKALPAAIELGPAVITVEDAARVVATAAVELQRINDVAKREEATSAGTLAVIRDRGAYDQLYRLAAKRLHPDAPSGDRSRWDRLQAAAAVLTKHHGTK
jgi:hypothetical protein